MVTQQGSCAGSSAHRLEMRGFQVTPQNEAQLNALKNFFDTNTGYYFQGGRVQLNKSLEILVPQELKTRFLHAMTNAGMSYSILYDRVKIKFYGRSQVRPLTEDFLRQEGPVITEDCVQSGDACLGADPSKCCNKNGCSTVRRGLIDYYVCNE